MCVRALLSKEYLFLRVYANVHICVGVSLCIGAWGHEGYHRREREAT